MDIPGKMQVTSHGNSNYVVGFVDEATAKLDAYFFNTKAVLYQSLMYCKILFEHETRIKLLNIRLKGAGEIIGNNAKTFCFNKSIRLRPSPLHAPQINCVAERFIQEMEVCARMFFFAATMGNEV